MSVFDGDRLLTIECDEEDTDFLTLAPWGDGDIRPHISIENADEDRISVVLSKEKAILLMRGLAELVVKMGD